MWPDRVAVLSPAPCQEVDFLERITLHVGEKPFLQSLSERFDIASLPGELWPDLERRH